MKTRQIRTKKKDRICISLDSIEKHLKRLQQRETQSVDNAPRMASANNRNISRGEAVELMMEFLRNKYTFRYNSVMGYTEYQINSVTDGFLPLDRRVMKRMALEVQLAGIGVTFNDVRYFLESDLLKEFNPVKNFLDGCKGVWDGKDRIRALANRVKCNNANWADWFYRWFLGMVNQWRSNTGDKEYGNSVVPLLISKQGFGKSTFCRRLLPPCLGWGFCDNLVMSEKKQVLQAMSQFLLINLDEFNQIPDKVQEGFLKNMLQLPSVKVKRPYGRHVEEMPRLCSFIATTNADTPLADSSGNRRFIAVELTEPIDMSLTVDYRQLYAQALAALDKGERCYFNQEETALIMESNRRFESESPAEVCFKSQFRPAVTKEEGRFMTTSEIFKELKSVYGSTLNVNGLSAFGRYLHNIDEMTHRITSRGTEYLVARNKPSL